MPKGEAVSYISAQSVNTYLVSRNFSDGLDVTLSRLCRFSTSSSSVLGSGAVFRVPFRSSAITNSFLTPTTTPGSFGGLLGRSMWRHTATRGPLRSGGISANQCEREFLGLHTYTPMPRSLPQEQTYQILRFLSENELFRELGFFGDWFCSLPQVSWGLAHQRI